MEDGAAERNLGQWASMTFCWCQNVPWTLGTLEAEENTMSPQEEREKQIEKIRDAPLYFIGQAVIYLGHITILTGKHRTPGGTTWEYEGLSLMFDGTTKELKDIGEHTIQKATRLLIKTIHRDGYEPSLLALKACGRAWASLGANSTPESTDD